MDKRLLGFIPVPVLVFLILFFHYVLKSSSFYDPGWLISITNTLFVAVICFAVAFIAMRNYRLTGRLQILLLGCGVLSFGIGGVIAGFVRGLPGGVNLNVTIYNTGALFGALFLFIAALILISGISPEIGSRRKGSWLAAGYLGVILFMAAITLASAQGVIPPFFIQGQGPTPLRQGILGTADALFAFSFLVFLAMYVRNKEIFLYWYSLALLLTSISLTAFFIEISVGNLTSWTGRTAQYIGGIYFLIAIRSAIGGAKARKTTLDNIITASLSPPVEVREVLESITDGFFFLDRTWNFTYVNKKAASFWGRTPSELLGKNIWQTIPQAVGTIFYEQYRKALSEQRPVSFEAVSPSRGDWVEVRTYPSKGGLSVYFNDITERKRAEEALELAARYPRENPNPVMRLGRGRVIDFANAPALQLLKSIGSDMGRDAPAEIAEPAVAALKSAAPRQIEKTYGGRAYVFNFAPISELGYVNVYTTDITERKQAEQQLRESEKRLRTQMERMPIGCIVFDRHNRFSQLNPAAERILGYNARELQDRHAMVIVPEAEGSHVDNIMRRLAAGDMTAHSENENVTKDGRVIMCHWTNTPLQDGAGNFIGFLSMVQDITERKRAEQALRESEAQFRTLANAIPQLCWMANADGWIFWYNDRWYEYTGTTPQQMEGWGWRSVHDPDALPKVLERWQAAIAAGEPWEDTFPLRRQDGSYRWFLSRALPIVNGEGKVARWFGTNTDVTEQWQAEEALRTQADLLRLSFDAIIVWRIDGAIESWNVGAERLYGFSEQEAVGRVIHDLLSTVFPKPWAEIRADLIEKGSWEGELRHRTRDGHEVIVSARKQLIRDGNGLERVLATNRDITERKRAEEERELGIEFLRIVNASTGIHDLVKAAATFLQEQSGCEAVGIRLRDGDDYPYCEARGFPKQFVLMEDSLGARNAAGEVIRDTDGYPLHDCMCGNVICGRFDPAKPFFTAHGSFWSNSTTELLAGTTEADRQSRTRNRCNGEGYESVALIPLHAGQECLGLLQLNDRRKGQFSAESINLWETLAGYLGVALAKTMAQEALRESEEQFRTLANAIPQLCWIANADGWIFWYNERWYEYTGTTPQQMEGWGWQSVHDPDALPKVLERWQAAIAAGEPWEDTFPLRGQDGSYHWFLSRALPIVDGEGKIARWFGTNTDITEQRRAEEKVRESEERLRMAKGAAQLGIHEWRPDTGELIWDGRTRELWAVGSNDPVNYEVFMSRLHPEDRAQTQAAVDRALDPSGTGQYYAEHRVVHPNRTIWVAATGHVTFESGRPVRLVGTVQDISERKAFQAELQRLVNERTAKLKELVGELEHFSYTITHDMRAPLRGMHGFSSLMAEECQGCERRDATDFLRRIQTSALRMDALITDSLNYSKAVRQELPREPVDVGALLRGMLDSYPEFQPEKAQIEITGELPLVMGNKAGLTQVLSNLLGNAIKFVKPGQKPEIRVWGEVCAEAESGNAGEERVKLWVEDNGVGIPDSMKPKIFDLFSRGHPSYEGTGLGLALARKVVDHMGGKVGVESEEGRGSRFWVELRPGDVRVKAS